MANRGTTLSNEVFSIKDLQHYGSKKMDKSTRDYYNEGAMDLITLRSNEAAYDRYMIRPRVLRDISGLDTSTQFLGMKTKFPFGISPTAMPSVAHPDGEVGISKACAESDTPMGLSNYSTMELEKVISHRRLNPYVMQISLLKNKPAMIRLMKRAEAAGFNAFFVTLDCPYLGRRLNEYRNESSVPKGMEFPNLFPGVDVTNLADGDESMAYDDSLEWADIVPFFRKHTKMQVWAKGIYTAEDADLAVKHGFDGILISNHGGRQLDDVPSTLDALREIAPAVRRRVPLAVDGGIRRGTDIFKALALGADFCLAGRPALWGLAYDGQKGVKLALDLFYEEFKVCMALSGCRNVAAINKNCVSLLQPDGRLLKL
ncbi:Aldolase-type TIM barrel [Penicillium malachiteum]|nr:Aldolase-type TIM barrel [Penicillium malachiteum]